MIRYIQVIMREWRKCYEQRLWKNNIQRSLLRLTLKGCIEKGRYGKKKEVILTRSLQDQRHGDESSLLQIENYKKLGVTGA